VTYCGSTRDRIMKKKLLIIEDEISVAKQLKWGLGKDYDCE